MNRTLMFGLALLFAVIVSRVTSAQDKNLVFNKLRQLPDLGACPNDPAAADPDLQKVLKAAVTQARDQAKDLSESVEGMKNAGLIAPEIAKRLHDSAEKLRIALSDPDACVAARAFAQLGSGAPVNSVVAATIPGGNCATGTPPCVNQPREGETVVRGRLALDGGTKVSDNTTAKLKIGNVEVLIKQYVPADGTFEQVVPSPLNSYNQVELVQEDARKKVTSSGPVAVEKAAGQPDKISISTDVLDFGHQSMQTASEAKPVTVTNNDDKQTLQLLPSASQLRNFRVSGCQNPIDKGQQCTFNVTFTPYPAKMRERFLYVVPAGSVRTFELLRKELSDKEALAEKAEESWRVEARCATEKPGKTDPDCPEHRSPAEPVANAVTTQQRWTAVLEKRDEISIAEQNLHSQFNAIKLEAVPDHWKFPFTQAVVGVDMSAPTSNTIKQSYFVDFDLLAPLKMFPFVKKNEDPLENRLWVWLNPRVTSLPQAANFSAVSTINETGSFFDAVKNGKLNDIVNGLDINGGFEYALVKPRDGIPWWNEYVNTQARMSPSLIAGVGVSTPFSTNRTEVSSTVTQAVCDAFGAPAGQQFSDKNGLVCTYTDASGNVQSTPFIKVDPTNDPNHGLRSYVDFYTPDRSRFFRRYYAGLRFKTYFFSQNVHSYCKPFESRPGDEGDCAAPYDIFPGIIDLTFGRDEAVTAGRLSGWLFRIEGVYPLPWYQGIHIFGSIYTKLASSRADQPFTPYTIQAPQAGAATDLNTFRYGVHLLDRDYFRVGIGVDLIQVFKKTGQPDKKAPPAPATDSK